MDYSNKRAAILAKTSTGGVNETRHNVFSNNCSADTVKCDSDEERQNYPIEFLNSLTPSGMPPHKLNLHCNVTTQFVIAPGALQRDKVKSYTFASKLHTGYCDYGTKQGEHSSHTQD